jgi:malate synthase
MVVPSSYVSIGGLKVHPTLATAMEEVICPGTGCSAVYFWSHLERITKDLRPELEHCLSRRDELQVQIDAFYTKLQQMGAQAVDAEQRAALKKQLVDNGYLHADGGPVSVTTQFVDPEVASTPGPQLVCPSDNARFLLNAVNSRWGSLYDALYGFDVIPETAVDSKSGEHSKRGGYNPVRGEAVIEFANGLLDGIAPLANGKWSEVTRFWPKFVGGSQQLEVLLKSGVTTSLSKPQLFVGAEGNLGPPAGNTGRVSKAQRDMMMKSPAAPDQGRIFLKHHGLHLVRGQGRSYRPKRS